MVLALAGDSTTTSVVVPGSNGASSSTTIFDFRDFTPRAAAPAFFAVFLAVFFLAIAMGCLVNRLVVARRAGVLEARALEHPAKVFEGDSAVDLHEGALDYVLELDRVDRTRAAERKEVAPGVGGKSAALVRSHHSECHWHSQTFVHSPNLFVQYMVSKRVNPPRQTPERTGAPAR